MKKNILKSSFNKMQNETVVVQNKTDLKSFQLLFEILLVLFPNSICATNLVAETKTESQKTDERTSKPFHFAFCSPICINFQFSFSIYALNNERISHRHRVLCHHFFHTLLNAKTFFYFFGICFNFFFCYENFNFSCSK